MNNEADVWLVDSQAKRFGRHNDVELSTHESLLNLFALLRLHLPVVAARVHVVGCKAIRKVRLRSEPSLHRRFRFLRSLQNAADALPFRLTIHRPKDFQKQIRPLDPGIDNNRIFQTQLLDDVMLNVRRRCSRQRQNRRLAQAP